MLGGGFHDNLPDGRAPRIEDMVKPLLEELRGFLDAAVNNSVQVLREGETEALTSPLNPTME